MQVVSGPIGKERVHYEAPAADAARRAKWRRSSTGSTRPAAIDPVLKAALAHLWFVTIHPFDDGNGRIARAIADMALARSEQSPQRFYSMSAQIRLERNDYYDILERTQKGDAGRHALDGVVPRLPGPRLRRRGDDAGSRPSQGAVLGSACRRVVSTSGSATGPQPAARRVRGQAHLIEMGEARRSARQDTASRDINDLVRRGILAKDAAGGRSTSYSLVEPGEGEGIEDYTWGAGVSPHSSSSLQEDRELTLPARLSGERALTSGADSARPQGERGA